MMGTASSAVEWWCFHVSQNHEDPGRGNTARAPPSPCRCTHRHAEGQPVVLNYAWITQWLAWVFQPKERKKERKKNIHVDSRGNMDRCFKSGRWYFCQVIDVENPSNTLDISKKHHGIANVEKLRFVEIYRLFNIRTLFIVEIIDYVSVRNLLLISNTRHVPNILPNLRQHPCVAPR